jgi:hypothetical protein
VSEDRKEKKKNTMKAQRTDRASRLEISIPIDDQQVHCLEHAKLTGEMQCGKSSLRIITNEE